MTPTPRPEHPRPDRFRPEWLNLNGEWEFSNDIARVGLERDWQSGETTLRETIVVPFAHQWALSGLRTRGVDEIVWYARGFDVPEDWLAPSKDLLLHFGAVDYRCRVWINGVEAGHNRGGHVPFALNVAPLCKPGANRVVVRVEDSLDPHLPRGKQAVDNVSRSCDYHNTTGIWQTVWLESVPSVRIEEFVLTTTLDTLSARVMLARPLAGLRVGVTVSSDGQTVAQAEAAAHHGVANLQIPIPDAKTWSPESPFLYDVRLTLLQGGQEVDAVESYAGLREIDIQNGRFLLNGEPVYLRLVLDQGYWPDGGLTAPTDEALRRDVEIAKELGFNGARKHQKVEDPRWLYWCDRLGLLVWGEMPNARAWNMEAEEMFLAEWQRAVVRDANHPCIVTWAPINESWGIPQVGKGHAAQTAYVERVVAVTRRLDGTRPVVDNDGWEHTGHGDLYSIHDYTATGDALRARYAEAIDGGPMLALGWGDHPLQYLTPGVEYRGEPVVLSEVAGFLVPPEGVPEEELDKLYTIYGNTSIADLPAKYRDLMEAIADIPFVVGFCTTQLTDVEQEVNGLVGYDRAPKADFAEIKAIHDAMPERNAKVRQG